MIISWMLWSIGLGAVLGIAAWAGDRVLCSFRLPTRWIWVAALIGTISLPGARLLSQALSVSAMGIPDPAQVVRLEPLMVTISNDSGLRALDDVLPIGWGLLTLGLGFLSLVGAHRLQRLRNTWTVHRLGEADVYVSEVIGPAVMGVLEPRIVLPRWVLSEPAEAQELIMVHELEHLWARDGQLLFWTRMLVFLFPWNVVLWLQARRLNLAVELDCDRRVLQRMPNRRRAYGGLLLDVGARHSGLSGLMCPGLADGPTLLEHRIRDLMWRKPKGRTMKAVLLGSLAMLVTAFACMAPGLEDGGSIMGPEMNLGDSMPPSAAATGEPTFTPFTEAPVILNRDKVAAAMESEYPPLLRDAGIGGTANVWFNISETGEVLGVRLNTSSGHGPLDAAALRVAEAFMFAPARNGNEPAVVWIALDIMFNNKVESEQKAEGETTVPIEDAAAVPIAEDVATQPIAEDLAAKPTFTPFTESPDIRNRREVATALEEHYPPLLREAGIGGTVNVWIFVDESGEVKGAQINRSSGHEALDEAALSVARVFSFSPALNRDQAVPVWIALDIKFETR